VTDRRERAKITFKRKHRRMRSSGKYKGKFRPKSKVFDSDFVVNWNCNFIYWDFILNLTVMALLWFISFQKRS